MPARRALERNLIRAAQAVVENINVGPAAKIKLGAGGQKIKTAIGEIHAVLTVKPRR